ncbi:MAG: hypothetical protein ACRDJH_05180 [Thermomicrobiales bacterium]
MPDRLKTIQVEPGSQLDQLLEEAVEATILIEKAGMRYRLDRVDAPMPSGAAPRHGPAIAPRDDPLLGLIGILDEGEPTDIARFKDRYLADAAGSERASHDN